jgi:dihydrofolate reductase
VTLRYAMLTSVDGYVADAAGRFDWAMPDDEVHAAVNDLQRDATGYLLGRRMYEVMQPWETDPALAAHSPVTADFAAGWQAADKHVYTTTMTEAVTRRTTIHREFDPPAVAGLVAGGDYWVAGPTLAAAALAAGLVSEVHLFVFAVAVGGGLAALPEGMQLSLRLLTERRFSDGTFHLSYALD